MSKIAWTDETWNPIVGCSKVSAGCANCYAERMAVRLAGMARPGFGADDIPPANAPEHYACVITPGGSWNGTTKLVESALDKPLRWRKPRRVFVCSMSDLFHESVPDEWVDRVFAVMALCPQHCFQLLTKRPERMLSYMRWAGHPDTVGRTDRRTKIDGSGHIGNHICGFANGLSWPFPNVHLGVSVENQQCADERIPVLLQTPAAVRFVSLEPMLGPVDLHRSHQLAYDGGARVMSRIDWVVLGCESGSRRRPCLHEWMVDVVRQCKSAGVPVFVKQVSIDGKVSHDMAEWPAELRVREYPSRSETTDKH